MGTKQAAVRDKEKRFKSGEVIEIILKSLAVVTIVGGSIVFPNLPIVMATILAIIKKEEGFEPPQTKIKKALQSLEKRKIIEVFYQDDNVYIRLLKDNQIDILKYSIKRLLDFKREKRQWRGKWVLVVFDVPEKERKKRAFLRDLLKKLGFYQYQQSVYVFPYECFEEIDLIKKISESGRYLRYIIAEQLEEEEKIKKFFKI